MKTAQVMAWVDWMAEKVMAVERKSRREVVMVGYFA
jgi:hypothetical protein